MDKEKAPEEKTPPFALPKNLGFEKFVIATVAVGVSVALTASWLDVKNVPKSQELEI